MADNNVMSLINEKLSWTSKSHQNKSSVISIVNNNINIFNVRLCWAPFCGLSMCFKSHNDYLRLILLLFHFTGEAAEAQRGYVTWPCS